jgi:toxin ParE1/3/4
MAVDLVWLPQALVDVREIYVQIGLENPRAAERFFDNFERKATLITHQPRIGVRRPDIRQGVRMIVEPPYIILYETRPDTDTGPVDRVEIVRLVDGRRDLRALY